MPRRPKPQTKATPDGAAAAASSPSTKVSIGNGTQGADPTYTDRLKSSARLRAQLATKHPRTTDPTSAARKGGTAAASGDTQAAAANDNALHQHVKAMLDYVTHIADSSVGDTQGGADTAYAAGSADSSVAANAPTGDSAPSSSDTASSSVGAWEERSYDIEMQIQDAVLAMGVQPAPSPPPAPPPAESPPSSKT